MNSTSLSIAMAPADGAFYIESSVLPGLTLGEYRRSRSRRPGRWQRMRELAGLGGGGTPDPRSPFGRA
jgi:hypothetical protein